jgi:hypothetical protein
MMDAIQPRPDLLIQLLFGFDEYLGIVELHGPVDRIL